MIRHIRDRLGTHSQAIALAGVMISGTVALAGFWITFNAYHEQNIARIAILETIVRSNTDWRNGQEKTSDDARSAMSEIKGELDVLRHEHENLEHTVQAHIQDDGYKFEALRPPRR